MPHALGLENWEPQWKKFPFVLDLFLINKEKGG
jgi:hypothetical protein